MRSLAHWTTAIVVVASSALMAGCERPPVEAKQIGYRGVGMELVSNTRAVAARADLHQAPAPQPPAAPGTPAASTVYKNVKVLGDLSITEFARVMTAMTEWVSPEQGCNYCHVPGNFESENIYTKIVARRMLQMTQGINKDWKTHVADTGVTCYTCHRGQPVPTNVWYNQAPAPEWIGFAGNKMGQNSDAMSTARASLPNNTYAPYLAGTATEIRVIGPSALPAGHVKSIGDTEATYGLMMHMSDGLGVNCTFCHNSRSFSVWEASPPQRATAWYGIRMARDINATYIDPLKPVFPANRLGDHGDPAKVNCTTCHQGVSKPLNGANMLRDYPELSGTKVAAMALTAMAPTANDAVPSSVAGGAVAASAALPARILFEVGKVELSAEARSLIASAAKSLGADVTAKASLSGFADKSGNADQNLELAKQRAFAVRDALKAAGVSEDRIVLQRLEFAIGGVDADARRVEINMAR